MKRAHKRLQRSMRSNQGMSLLEVTLASLLNDQPHGLLCLSVSHSQPQTKCTFRVMGDL